MEWMNRKIRNEKGELVLESLIVYLITMMLLFFILAIFSVLYQRWNLQIIANESATRFAQTYRLTTADASTGFVSSSETDGTGPYRYFVNGILETIDKNNYFESMDDKLKSRLDTYALGRLSKTTYAKNVTEPDCDVDVKEDAMGRRHLVLTITGEYTVPFGETLDYFGFDSIVAYEVTAYADCVDVIDYVNYVDYVHAQTNLDKFGSKIIDGINAVFKFFSNHIAS